MFIKPRAILPLLVAIFFSLSDYSASAQCGPGKISKIIQGFGSIVTVDNAYAGTTGVNALGDPDGVAAYFSHNGQYIIIDLIDTVRIGQTYSFIWRQHQGMPDYTTLWWSESIDGTNFIDHSLSGLITTTNKSFFNSEFTAEHDTRFIKIYMAAGTNDFYFDAISYYATKCYSDICGAGDRTQLISGNGTYVEQSYVTNPTYANYVPDGSGALFLPGSAIISFGDLCRMARR